MNGFIVRFRFRQALVLSYSLIVSLLLLPMPNALSFLNVSSQACAPSYVRHQGNQGSKSTDTGSDLLYLTDAYGLMEFPSQTMHTFQVPLTEGYAWLPSSVPLIYPNNDVVCPNGGFESGDFSCWAVGGNLPSRVQSKVKLEETYAALLGDKNPANCRGGLPIGNAWISQTFQIPACGDPVLSFSYRLFSFDEHSESFSKLYDTFDVRIDDLSDDAPSFLILRDGSDEPYGCDDDPYDSGWTHKTYHLSSIAEFSDPARLHDLRGKVITVYFYNYSRDPGYDNAWYNTWVYIDNVEIEYPPLTLEKSADPTGPVHEGDVIAYTLAYTNTSLITQTITITDLIPFNLTVGPGTIQPAEKGHIEGSEVVWDLGATPSCASGQVSFQARVALLPSLHQPEAVTASPQDFSPARVLPVPIACDTTRFWAAGVTRQPPLPNPHTIEVTIPPGTNPSAIWLAVKSTGDIPLTVDGVQAERVATSHGLIGASLWSARISPQAVASGTITIVTYAPRRLNAIFLFDEDDPPFDPAALDDFQNTTRTFTYTLDISSVATKTIDVLLPYMDITYWTDDLLPDTRSTQVDVEFDGQSHRITANDPNLGNGLLMTQFPFTISPFTEPVRMKELTVTVDTEDSIYTLGPRVCRPVYIENTAWLCSEQAGCISDTVVIIPDDFMVLPEGNIYLPLILKAQP